MTGTNWRDTKCKIWNKLCTYTNPDHILFSIEGFQFLPLCEPRQTRLILDVIKQEVNEFILEAES